MFKIVDFFNQRDHQPYITILHKNKLIVLEYYKKCQKKYYYFKQYGFNGVNL
jgi:hypothetical protein